MSICLLNLAVAGMQSWVQWRMPTVSPTTRNTNWRCSVHKGELQCGCCSPDILQTRSVRKHFVVIKLKCQGLGSHSIHLNQLCSRMVCKGAWKPYIFMVSINVRHESQLTWSWCVSLYMLWSAMTFLTSVFDFSHFRMTLHRIVSSSP